MVQFFIEVLELLEQDVRIIFRSKTAEDISNAQETLYNNPT